MAKNIDNFRGKSLFTKINFKDNATNTGLAFFVTAIGNNNITIRVLLSLFGRSTKQTAYENTYHNVVTGRGKRVICAIDRGRGDRQIRREGCRHGCPQRREATHGTPVCVDQAHRSEGVAGAVGDKR